MDNPFGKIIDILIAVVILFLFPIMYFSHHQDTLTQHAVKVKTSEFADTVRTQGYITKNMYETFLGQLDLTNNIYDINLEHKKLALEPEYRMKTPDDVINDQNKAWTGSNTYHNVPVYTNIPTIADPITNTGTINTDTNGSIMEKAVDGAADPSHIHSVDCYKGDLNNTVFQVHYNYFEGRDSGANIVILDKDGTKVLLKSFELDGYIFENHMFNMDINFFAKDASHGQEEGRTWHLLLLQYCEMLYKSKTGNKLIHDNSISFTYSVKFYDLYHDLSYCVNNPTLSFDDGITKLKLLPYLETALRGSTPLCNQIIKSIAPTNPLQTVYLNEPLITTVKVTYLNGSTKTKIATVDFTPNTIVKDKVVNLSLYGSANGVATEPYKCTIRVTVIPKSKTCVNGHNYNLNSNGTDPGCPYCNGWLSSLAVTTPNTGELTIYSGTSLEENGVVILATYLNGRKEFLYNGYANNLDKNYVGIQTVTISYKGKYTSLKVIVKRNLKRCEKCGRYYELYPDGTDPGCPYCRALIPVFTGNILKYYAMNYSKEILRELYEGNGTYYFKEGDYFSINVINKNETFATRLIRNFIPNAPLTDIKAEYGGTIRDETLPDNN